MLKGSLNYLYIPFSLLILFIICFIVYISINKPNYDIVNGIYINECCSSITISDDIIFQGSKSASFDLENMKFGTTGYVDGRFTRNSLEKNDANTAIVFYRKDGSLNFNLNIDENEYVFRNTKLQRGDKLR